MTRQPVKPAKPMITFIKIDGNETEFSTLKAVIGEYKGGKEGNSIKKWSRVISNSIN